MSLKLMYITNRPEIAQIAENAGVDRIFVDMEYIGKSNRQGGMNTVQCRHTVEDVSELRGHITKSELMVRINPIHDATAEYTSSEEEIDAVIGAGADVVMLPYFKTADEVKRFVECVAGRATVFPLVETPEAAECLDEILEIDGIDEIHIGLNDMSLALGKKFMFELLCDGTVERICRKCRDKGITYGFGGIAALGKGMLPCEHVIMEHYRLGSQRAILSRSFCNCDIVTDIGEIKRIFETGLKEIREYEAYCACHPEEWEQNRILTAEKILGIAQSLKK
ncbi:MAG: aldolase [Clostridia bacterium]|nr:aldolase [Clostridia bacterium]